MKRPPELLKHSGILTNWRNYPEGSIERAKSLGLELLATCGRLDATIGLWEAKCRVVAKEQPWKPLGLKSCEDFIKAVTGRSDANVRKQITKTQAIRERRASHPDETQQQTADAVGCDKGLVSRVSRGLTESSETEQKVNIPDWITHQDIRAAFRKLPADERARLEELPAERRRGAVRAAAVAAGIIRVPSKLQLAQKAFVRLNGDDRLEFISWMMTTQLATEPCA